MSYATTDDVIALWRKLSPDEIAQSDKLIPIVEDSLRQEALFVGKNLDEMIASGVLLENVVKSVVVDIVARTIDQNTSDNSLNLTQESQSVNGYSWSGTYTNTGGGIGILKKDLKRLGLRKQRYGYLNTIGFGESDED